MNTTIKTWVGTVIIIIIAITVGVFVWLYEKTQPEIAQPVQVSIAKKVNKTADLSSEALATDDWQTYRNEKYGFEFKYPANFKINYSVDFTKSDSLKENHFSSDLLIDVDKIKDGDELFLAEFQEADSSCEKPVYAISIDRTKFRNINTWYAEWKTNMEKPSNYEGITIHPKVTSAIDIKIQDISAKRIIIEGYPYEYLIEAVIKDSYLYQASFDGQQGLCKDKANNENAINNFIEKNTKILDQVFKSFSFIN